MVDTYGTYFGCAKVRVSFLYPTLDLSMIDIFKVICDGQLEGDREVSPLKH